MGRGDWQQPRVPRVGGIGVHYCAGTPGVVRGGILMLQQLQLWSTSLLVLPQAGAAPWWTLPQPHALYVLQEVVCSPYEHLLLVEGCGTLDESLQVLPSGPEPQSLACELKEEQASRVPYARQVEPTTRVYLHYNHYIQYVAPVLSR